MVDKDKKQGKEKEEVIILKGNSPPKKTLISPILPSTPAD